MVPGIVLGVIGGLAVAKLIAHRRRRWAGGGGGGRGPRRLFWMARQLDLDPQQRDAVRGLFHQVRHAADGVKQSSRGVVDEVLGAVGDESFDRARVEAATGRVEGSIGQARTELVNAVGQLHQILRPEQRQRLRDLLARR
jgi:Spy/CpxP family protein refolding chaperone